MCFIAETVISDAFYTTDPHPWNLDFGFHAFSDGFLALSVKAHLETLQKCKKNLAKVIILSTQNHRFWVESSSTPPRRPRLPQPPLELPWPPSELLRTCVSVYLRFRVSVYLCKGGVYG